MSLKPLLSDITPSNNEAIAHYLNPLNATHTTVVSGLM